MLKLGICTAAQDTPIQRWWRRGPIAANLLPTRVPASAEELDRFERILAQLRLSNGTVKTTARNRLAAVDDKVGALLPTVFPPHRPLLVEDWAVSSGITAGEWYRLLRQVYPQATFTASDWMLYLVEARRPQSADAFIVEPSGIPIQYIRAPYVVSLTEMQHPVYVVNRAVQRRAMREWEKARKDFRIPAEWDNANGSLQTDSGAFLLRRLPLVHPEVMQMRNDNFRIKQHSVFRPLEQPAHVIRTMNILNRSYFTATQLRSAAEAIGESLHIGGLWIVGRTVTESPLEHEVTVLQKSASGWEPLLRMGKGSEMESILWSRDPALANA